MSSLGVPRPLGKDIDPVDTIRAAALAQAKRWNLVCANGEIVCLRGCGREATLPSLLCVTCLAFCPGGIVFAGSHWEAHS